MTTRHHYFSCLQDTHDIVALHNVLRKRNVRQSRNNGVVILRKENSCPRCSIPSRQEYKDLGALVLVPDTDIRSCIR